MKNINSFSAFIKSNSLNENLALDVNNLDEFFMNCNDLDIRNKWMKAVNKEFDKYHVDYWLNYIKAGGDVKKMIGYGNDLKLELSRK